MAKLIYPTSVSIKAPVLLGSGELRELDRIIDAHLPRVMERQAELHQADVEERLHQWLRNLAEYSEKPPTEERIAEERRRYERLFSRSSKRQERKLTLDLASGNRLAAKSFEDAAIHPGVASDLPIGFQYRLDYPPVELRIVVNPELTWKHLEVTVGPENEETGAALLGELRRWCARVAAPSWQQWWVEFSRLAFAFWLIFAVISVFVFSRTDQTRDKRDYKAEAQRLLEKGVSSTDHQRALEILLAIASDYPRGRQLVLGSRFWFTVASGTVVLVIIAFPPSIVIGIGKGELRLKRWRKWISFVFFAIPTFIASNFIWPLLVDLVRRILAI